MNLTEQRRLLAEQFKYLRKIKKMKILALRAHHNEVFAGSRYSKKIPKWVHRSHLERRLFYAFCIRHYHYPKGHEIRIKFFKVARAFLRKQITVDSVERAEETLKNQELYSLANVRSMHINEVDRALSLLGIYVDATTDQRRTLLHEWYNEPLENLVKVLDDEGKLVASRRTGRLNNQYKLRRLILRFPTMDWETFRLQFADRMPTVSRSSFNNTRSALRRAGYDIPKFTSVGVIRTVNGRKTIGSLTIEEFDDTALH